MSSASDLNALGIATSECDGIVDTTLLQECKDKEDAAAASAATNAEKENEGKPKKFTPPRSSMDNLDCSMDGFNQMFQALIENIFIALALVKESFSYLIPEDLGLAVQYGWDGLMGLGGWIGFLFSAGYYVGLDFG